MGKPIRILLVDVNYVALDTAVDMREYPIGLVYIGTVLKDAYADRIDLRIESYRHKIDGIDHIDRLLSEWTPDLLGLRSLTMGRGPLHAIASLAKDRYGVPVVIAGGPHSSDNMHDVLSNAAFDGAVIGEGEHTAVELVGRLLNGEPLDDIPGFAVRRKEGVAFEPRALIEHLDDLPMPDHSLVDFIGINRGHVDFSFRRNVKHANLFTSRGCPYRCLYCHQVFGKRMRPHSAERVLEEIKRLHDGWGITHFQIIDDIFNIDRDRAMRFYELVIRENLDLVFSFPNGLRGDRVDDEMIDAMWEAGVRYICYAVESGSPRIQKLIQKHMKLDRIRRAIERSTERGIVCRGFFMLGFPTETEEEALQTVQFALDSDLVQAMFFTVVYFPGTPMYKLAEEHCDMSVFQLGLEDDYVRTREGPYAYSRERLDEIKKEAIRSFFFSPKRVDLSLANLPNFFPPRDVDSSFLANIISGDVHEEDVDPYVAARLSRHFLVADRFSQHSGFYV